jgi:hypothetical protein
MDAGQIEQYIVPAVFPVEVAAINGIADLTIQRLRKLDTHG